MAEAAEALEGAGDRGLGDCWIYHEKQDSQLCGQHALNALLQGPYFTSPDLAEIAAGLDAQEQELMLAAGADTEEAIRFAAEDSGNVNDGGFFSIEVLRQACARFGDLQLLSATSEEVVGKGEQQHADLTGEQAFLCNRAEHWFAIRQIRGQFLNLNSVFDKPEIISRFYLDAFLAQLRQDGYSVFVVRGAALPPQGFPEPEDLAAGGKCSSGEGGQWFALREIVEGGNGDKDGKKKGSGGGAGGVVKDVWAKLTGGRTLGGSGSKRGREEDGGDEDDDVARAIALSLQEGAGGSEGVGVGGNVEDEDEEMRRAIALSLQEIGGGAT